MTEEHGYAVLRDGKYLCDDKHADRSWWGPWLDPFMCVFDTAKLASRNCIPGDHIVVVPLERS